MSIKTVLLVVATLAVVSGFLSTVWDVSGWLMAERGNVPVRTQTAVQPDVAVEANTAGETSSSSSDNESSAPQKAETQPAEDPLNGIYDDKWVGTAEEIEALNSKLPPDSNPQPKTERPKVFEKPTVKDPYAPDERETAETEPDPKTVEQKGSGGQATDPYQGDDRETN